MRKGGSIALEAVRVLRGKGLDARLTVVGCTPPPADLAEDWIELRGFLDKNRPSDRAALEALYAGHHVFLLPTRSEAFGVVFCEAAAFGLPSVSYMTAGVSDAVRNGTSGILLPPGAPPEAFADSIVSMIESRDTYATWRKGARNWYETTVNWKAWGDRAEFLIRDIAAPSSVRPYTQPRAAPSMNAPQRYEARQERRSA